MTKTLHILGFIGFVLVLSMTGMHPSNYDNGPRAVGTILLLALNVYGAVLAMCSVLTNPKRMR